MGSREKKSKENEVIRGVTCEVNPVLGTPGLALLCLPFLLELAVLSFFFRTPAQNRAAQQCLLAWCSVLRTAWYFMNQEIKVAQRT